MENYPLCVMCKHEESDHDVTYKFCTVKDCKCPHFVTRIEGDMEGIPIHKKGDGRP